MKNRKKLAISLVILMVVNIMPFDSFASDIANISEGGSYTD